MVRFSVASANDGVSDSRDTACAVIMHMACPFTSLHTIFLHHSFRNCSWRHFSVLYQYRVQLCLEDQTAS